MDEQKLAIEALADAGASDALPLSIELLGSSEAELRATAVRGIGKLGGTEEIGMVVERLEDPEWFVRAAAARAIETILTNHPRTISVSQANRIADALGGKLVDRSWWVRANAARALARTGQIGADVLIRTAEGDDTYARDAALAALAMADLNQTARERLDGIIRRLLARQAQAGEVATA